MKYYYHPNMTPPPPVGNGEQPQREGGYPPQNGGYPPAGGQIPPQNGQYYTQNVPYGQQPYGQPYGQPYQTPYQPPYPPYGQPYPPPYPPNGFSPYGGNPYWEQQQKEAKKQLKRDGNGIGWGMVLTQVAGVLLSFVLPLLLSFVFPSGQQWGNLFYEAAEYALYSPISILLPMWLGLKLCKGKMEDVVTFAKPKWFLWFCCILTSFLFVFMGNLAGDIAAMFSPQTVENLNAAMGADPSTPLELALQVLYVGAIPALVEEIAFRGVALGVLRRYGDKFAIVGSALLFGLLHGNFVQIPFAYFMGLILGYTVVRTGSIVPAMLIHFINNAMSCLITYFTVNLGESEQTVAVMLMYGCWLVLGLLGLCLLAFCFKGKVTDCCKPYNGCLTPAKRGSALWLSAGMIVAVLLHLFFAVTFTL